MWDEVGAVHGISWRGGIELPLHALEEQLLVAGTVGRRETLPFGWASTCATPARTTAHAHVEAQQQLSCRVSQTKRSEHVARKAGIDRNDGSDRVQARAKRKTERRAKEKFAQQSG